MASRASRAGSLFLLTALMGLTSVFLSSEGCSGDTSSSEPPCSDSELCDVPSTVYFDTGLSSSFFDFPWPNDLRLMPDGHPDMSGFPNPDDNSILSLYIETIEEDIVGFGNNSPVYFRFTADIDEEGLPELPSDALMQDAPLFLVDVDLDSPDYGKRVPLHARFFSEAYMYSPSHLLAVAPAWGFPLRPSTTYAAVVFRDLGQANGDPLEPDPTLNALLTSPNTLPLGDDPELAQLFALYLPLTLYLDDAGIARSEVAIATVFTTQDPVSELGDIRDYLYRTQPTPQLDPYLEKPIWYVPEDRDYEKVNDEEAWLYTSTDSDPYDETLSVSMPYLQFEGRYRAPNFQVGEPPYAETGGAIVFDDQGDPVIQVPEEPLRFCLVVPKGPQPEQGWPIAIYAHGTGGSYKSVLYSGTYNVAEILTGRGVAVISIDEPLHGERAPEGTDPELMSFNFLNPDSARSNFRQAAIDVFYLTWLVRTNLKVPADVNPGGTEIRFDPSRVSFFGHSHGAISGALLVPFETDVQGSVLSEAGGGLSLTILLRKDYVDFAELFRTVLGMPEDEPLDEFHPVMALVQTLVDITDPINYAPFYIYDPIDGRARNVVQTEGFLDEATPPATIEAMVVAGRLPLIEPIGRTIYGLDLLGVEPAPRPLSLNVTGPDGNAATAGLAQFPEDNHYAVSRDYDAVRVYADFIESISYTGIATVE